jgi:Ca-activated chloride channel family protein
MKINALLDVNLIAHEAEDEVALLLELQAPAAPTRTTRPQASLQVVLDRSGSMSGSRLEGAKKALVALVRRLEPTDNFGLVVFDDTAEVVVPAGPLTDKQAVVAAIESVVAGGCTDLSAGYLRGLRELRRVAGAGGTVLLVSDGHVNAGIRDADELATVSAKAYADGLVTSTLGYGDGYDETMLAALARAGSGNHTFAADPDSAVAGIGAEVDGLLDKVVQAVSLTVHMSPSVELVRLYNDLPAQLVGPGQLMVELGDLYAQEVRKLLLKLKVPAMTALGLAQVATLEVAHVEVATLTEHVHTLPITVNVVPGDEAAGRVASPTVVSEVLFQEAQESKKQASEAFERGDIDGGTHWLTETKEQLSRALQAAPDAADIRAEIDEVQRMDGMTQTYGSSYVSKLARESYHRANRKRGRDGGQRD